MAEKAPEFEPPQACVARIMKNVLPPNMQITKDARAAFTRAAGIFIFYLTNCAHEFSRESKRSTITTADILKAIKELDFDELEPALQRFLTKYRQELAMNVSNKAKGTNAKKRSADDANLEDSNDNDEDDNDNDVIADEAIDEQIVENEVIGDDVEDEDEEVDDREESKSSSNIDVDDAEEEEEGDEEEDDDEDNNDDFDDEEPGDEES